MKIILVVIFSLMSFIETANAEVTMLYYLTASPDGETVLSGEEMTFEGHFGMTDDVENCHVDWQFLIHNEGGSLIDGIANTETEPASLTVSLPVNAPSSPGDYTYRVIGNLEDCLGNRYYKDDYAYVTVGSVCNPVNDLWFDSNTCPNSVVVGETITCEINVENHDSVCDYDYTSARIIISGPSATILAGVDSGDGTLVAEDIDPFGDPFELIPISAGDLKIELELLIDGDWVLVDDYETIHVYEHQCSNGESRCNSDHVQRCIQQNGRWIWNPTLEMCFAEQACVNGTCQSISPTGCGLDMAWWPTSDAEDGDEVFMAFKNEELCDSSYSIEIWENDGILPDDFTSIIQGSSTGSTSTTILEPWTVAYSNDQFSWHNQENEYYFEVYSNGDQARSGNMTVRPRTLLTEDLSILINEGSSFSFICSDYGAVNMSYSCIKQRLNIGELVDFSFVEDLETFEVTVLAACTASCIGALVGPALAAAACPETVGLTCIAIPSLVIASGNVCAICLGEAPPLLELRLELAFQGLGAVLTKRLADWTASASGTVFRNTRGSGFGSAFSKTFRIGDDVIEYVVYYDKSTNQVGMKTFRNALSSLEGGEKVLDFGSHFPSGLVFRNNMNYPNNVVAIKVFKDLGYADSGEALVSTLSESRYRIRDIAEELMLDGELGGVNSQRYGSYSPASDGVTRLSYRPIVPHHLKHPETGEALEDAFVMRWRTIPHENSHAVQFKRLFDELGFEHVPWDWTLAYPAGELFNDLWVMRKLSGQELEYFKTVTSARMVNEITDHVVDRMVEAWYVSDFENQIEVFRYFNLADELNLPEVKGQILRGVQRYADNNYLDQAVVNARFITASSDLKTDSEVFIRNLFRDDYESEFVEVLEHYRLIKGSGAQKKIRATSMTVNGNVAETGTAKLLLGFVVPTGSGEPLNIKVSPKSENISLLEPEVDCDGVNCSLSLNLEFGCDCDGAQEVAIQVGDYENTVTLSVVNNSDCYDEGGCSCSADSSNQIVFLWLLSGILILVHRRQRKIISK